MASELLAKAASTVDWNNEPPVPVEDILEKYLRLTLEVMPVGDGTRLGAISIKDATVWFQENLDDRHFGRYSFTLAHEIGHWQIHRPQLLLEQELPMTLGLVPRSDGEMETVPVDIICRDGASDPREREANAFAAFLLMPEKLMRTAYARLFPDGLDMPIKALKSNESKLDWINYNVTPRMIAADGGGFTNCSRETMNYRVKNLHMVNTSGTARLL